MERVIKVLVLLSSPSDGPNLRLDLEDRDLGRIQRDSRKIEFTKVHGVTLSDLLDAINSDKFDFIHISGHGNGEGFYLNDDEGKQEFISYTQVVSIINQSKSATSIRGALYMTCFSSEASNLLQKTAPYVITLYGETFDEDAIRFVKNFYNFYLRENDIDRAFRTSILLSDPDGEKLKAVITRRGITNNKDKAFYVVFPGEREEQIYIDITPAEETIATLSIPRDQFLSALSRKIRIHKYLFDYPREKSLLSIGKFVGRLSWKNRSEPVILHEVLKIKKEISNEACEVWADIILRYNDQYISKYRTSENGPDGQRILEGAISNFWDIYDYFFKDAENTRVLMNIIPEEMKISQGFIRASLGMAQGRLASHDMKASLSYLEQALSSLHDLMDGLTGVIVE